VQPLTAGGSPLLTIGILGTRGIPNRYGGFEECAEQVAVRLVQRGHRVSVYNPRWHEFRGEAWHGVTIIRRWAPETRFATIGQFAYDLACLNDARRRGFDLLLQLGYTSSSIWHRHWPTACRNVVNMDGKEWMRAKYHPLAKRFLKYAERLAALHADALVADSPGIQQHLAETYQRQAHYIPYGSQVLDTGDDSVPSTYGVSPFAYHLAVARLEPENQIELIIQGCLESGTDTPLLVVGSTSNSYGRSVVARYGRYPQIRFVGSIYDRSRLDSLRFYSHLYFHGHSAGGTNPSLLDAMGCRALIVAHDNPFNCAVLENGGLYFDDLRTLVAAIRSTASKTERGDAIERNVERIRTVFNWDLVTEQYEAVFRQAIDRARDH
jgi:glycosyltransferase involved in cell wall biosynthesis